MSEVTGKTFNAELLEKLKAFRKDNGYSLGEMGKKFGTNSTQICKYLNGKPEGDVERLEATIEDVLRAAARRRLATEVVLFNCDSARRIAATLELIRKTGDIGLIHGAAGTGKTCGSMLYLSEHPSALMITMSKWVCGGTAVSRTLFGAMETRSWPGNVPKCEWMVDRLKKSDRLIIVDNAHRLQPSGLEWLFDFHDATQVPIALVGNPEVLARIKKNDQQFSRVGVVREITIRDKDHVADTMIEQLAPQAKDIQDIAEQIVGERGHARALKKHLLLLPEMMLEAGTDFRKAMAMAHTQLVNDYKLVGYTTLTRR